MSTSDRLWDMAKSTRSFNHCAPILGDTKMLPADQTQTSRDHIYPYTTHFPILEILRLGKQLLGDADSAISSSHSLIIQIP